MSELVQKLAHWLWPSITKVMRKLSFGTTCSIEYIVVCWWEWKCTQAKSQTRTAVSLGWVQYPLLLHPHCSQYHDTCVPANKRQPAQPALAKPHPTIDYTKCNQVAEDQIWKKSVSTEQKAAKKWENNWQFLTEYDSQVYMKVIQFKWIARNLRNLTKSLRLVIISSYRETQSRKSLYLRRRVYIMKGQYL